MKIRFKNFITASYLTLKRAVQLRENEYSSMAQVFWTTTVVATLGVIAIYAKLVPQSELLSAAIIVRTPAELTSERTESEKRTESTINEMISPAVRNDRQQNGSLIQK